MPRFALLLSQLAAQPQRALGELDLLTPAEQQQIAAINQTAHPLPAETGVAAGAAGAAHPGRTGAGRCAAPAELSPDAAAGIRAGSRSQCGRRAAGDIVAVALPRSVQLSLALRRL